MEELLNFKKDAMITIIKCNYFENGLDKPSSLIYQVILSWNHGKYKTPDGKLYNDFVEAWGKTVDECIKQLKEDCKQINAELKNRRPDVSK